jgi:osmoprotectant transport system permease protein
MSAVLAEQLALLPDYLARHMLLTVVALAAGIVLSACLALALRRIPRLRDPVLAAASAVQTVPALALLALMVPALGRIGFLPAAIALTLYSVLPMLRNAVNGIENVDAKLIEAGRALGMTPNQLLLRVQLPLAMPVIVAGIRTAAVWVVGMATLSTAVGATSLGNYIFSGLQTQNYTAVLVGCVAATVLALVLDRLIGLVESAIAKRSRVRTLAAVGATLVVALAAIAPSLVGLAGSTRAPVLIGTKTFTEQYILGALLADVLDREGFRTRSLQSLGSTVAFDALVAGRIDCYVDYTGTIWTNYMKRTDNPGRDAIFREVRAWLAREHGIEIAARLGFENAYALALPRRRAEALGVRSIDDLTGAAPSLTVGGDYEIFDRPEWRDLTAAYGLAFRELVSMDSSLMYSAVAAGTVDLITAFSSDGRIPATDLVLLEDSRGALPPYDAVVLVSAGSAQRHDGLRRALESLDGAIDGNAMREANRSVDLEGTPVAAAAAELARELRK